MASAQGGKKTPRQRLWALARALFILSVCAAGLVVGLAVAVITAYSRDLPDVNKLKEIQPSATTRVFAANGELIATLYRENRTWVSIKDVPEVMRKAIIASEDSRFYQHVGIDPVGVARVLWLAVRKHAITQGASTITMQLARSVFLNNDPTPRRKIQEMLVAWQLERKFTKDQLLEFYLNQIYFGSGAYGVQAAAETYFGKKASALDLAEAAMLVGVVPAPSDYSPFVNPKLADERQALVLRRMVETGSITEAEAREAREQALQYARPRKDPFVLKYPYFTTYVLRTLARKYGEEKLYTAGLNITTTLDPAMQDAAQEAVAEGLREAASQHVSQAALVAIEPQTGYIKAMVGGSGWSTRSQFNRAWQAERPAGSSFKIFVYSTALEAGYSPDSIVPDSPVSLRVGPGDEWSPKNSDGRFMGSIPLRTAIQFSRNTVSARLVDALTPARVVDLAYKMGVRSHIDPILSIALGALSVSPLDMASALTVIANNGRRVEPVAIKLVKNSDGQVLEDHRHPTSEAVLNPITALAMAEMMQGVVDHGTGYSARLDGRPAAGKTGTTDAHHDAWFVGFVPQLAAAVWVGNDDNSAMYGTYGGDVPAPMWRRFMTAALKNRPVAQLGADDKGQVAVRMCRESGLRATTQCPDPEVRTVAASQVPMRFCGTHVFVPKGGAAPAPPTPTPAEASPEVEATPVDEVPTPMPSTEDDATPEPTPQAVEPAPTPTPAQKETAPPPPPPPHEEGTPEPTPTPAEPPPPSPH